VFSDAWLCAAGVVVEPVPGVVELLDAVEICAAEVFATIVVAACVWVAAVVVLAVLLAGVCAGLWTGFDSVTGDWIVWIAWLDTPSKIPEVS